MNNFYLKNREYISHLQTQFHDKDMFILKLITFQWILVSLVGEFLYNSSFGFLSGMALFLLTVIAYNFLKGTLAFRNISAITLLSFSVVLIQVSAGRIEMHFYIFGLLSFLIIYKDMIPVTVGAAFVTLHHLIFNYLQEYNIEIFNTPIIVFNYGCGLDIVLLHAAFVVFEWFVLLRLIAVMQKDSMELINSRNALNSVNKNLESMVRLRTEELVVAKDDADNANSMKSEFLANMSHEIRTPMNAIIGFTDLLKKQEMDNVSSNYVHSIQDSSKLLLSLINDILDLSKVEAGKIELSLEPVSLHNMMSELNSVFSLRAQTKNIVFLTEIESDIPPSLMLDETRLRQVLFNLISNAIKFTAEGHVKVSISDIKTKDSKKIDLKIVVQDTGIGIKEEDKEIIFKAFRQQRHQSTKVYGGTGLGLTIVTKLLDLMHAKVEVKSTLGEGASFEVVLKDVAISEEESINKLETKEQEVLFEEAKILIVDDIDLNRNLLREYFKNTPLVVSEAINGREAVQACQDERYDLILMDVKMPIMDGYEATRLIKASEDIPIIAITASVVNINSEERNKIFDDFLHKPIEYNNLTNVMCKYLKCELIIQENMELEKNRDIILSEIGCSQLHEKLSSAKNSGDMQSIEGFALALRECASENSTIKNLTEKILSAVDSFDVEVALKLLNSIKE